MALTDIVADSGDGQDFIMDIPAGDSGDVPSDVLAGVGGIPMCTEIPAASSGGGVFVFVD